MAAIRLVDIDEVLTAFEERGLVVISKEELRIQELLQKRDRDKAVKMLLSNDSLSPGDIVKHKLLHFTSAEGVKVSKLFREGEIFKNSEGKTRVTVEAIKRLRILKNIA